MLNVLAALVSALPLFLADDSDAWKKFEPDGGGFSVLLPGAPKNTSRPAKAGDSIVEMAYVYPVDKDHGFSMNVTIFKGQKLTLEAQNKAMATMTQKLPQGYKAKLSSAKDLEFKNGVAKELLLQQEKPNDAVIRVRIYVDENSIRQFAALGVGQHIKEKDSEKFFDSIRLPSK